MSQENLNRLRFVVPGLMLTVALEPLLKLASLATQIGLPDVVGYPIPVITFGFVYHVLDLRRLTFKDPIERINQNIKTSLLECCGDRPEILASSSFLREGRKLMHVFYKIVDSDPTLSEKAKRVRFNGLIWSSLADLQVVGAIGALVYLVSAPINSTRSYLLASLGLLAVVLLVRWWLMPRITQRHLDLSNEQLEVIAQEHREDVCQRIEALINHADQ